MKPDRASIESRLLFIASNRVNTLNLNAQRHLKEGFLRRMKMLQTNMAVFDVVAIPSRTKPLDFDECFNLNVHLNSFYVQTRGTMDNLAWALHYQYCLLGNDDENNPSVRRKCQLLTKEFCDTLSTRLPRLAEGLKEHLDWAKELRHLRDPVAHRVPLHATRAVADPSEAQEIQKLYENVISGGVDDRMSMGDFVDAINKANNAGHYKPIFVVSSPEGLVPIPIHAQTATDYDTLLCISEKVLTALVDD